MVTTTHETMSNDKAFKQLVQSYIKQGYDINQATSLAQGNPADGVPRQQQQQQFRQPDPIIPAPPPSKIGDKGGSRLKINKKAKRNRGQLRGGTTQQRISLNAPASDAGGVNIGGR